MRRLNVALSILTLVASTGSAFAQPQGKPDAAKPQEAPKAKPGGAAIPAGGLKVADRKAPPKSTAEGQALLKAARDAAMSLKSVTFKIDTTSEGVNAGLVLSVEVAARKTDSGDWALLAQGEAKRTGKRQTAGDGPETFHAASDGTTARAVNDAKKEVSEAAITGFDDLRIFFMRNDGGRGVPWEIFEPTPYSEADKAGAVEDGGSMAVDGVDCRVLKVTSNEAVVTKYYLSPKDSLPRKIERSRVLAGQAGDGKVFQSMAMTAVEANAPVGAGRFVVSVPDGYTVRAINSRPQQTPKAVQPKVVQEKPEAKKSDKPYPESSSELLAVGTAAPDWTLKDGSGVDRKLSDYKGKIVVLDFWGTWCPPCRRALPLVQQVHEKYKDKGVVVLGMNWEQRPDADPAKYMRENQIDYGLILRAETVAQKYKVAGWPTLYVIGADGKVFWAEMGFDADLDKTLGAVIDDAIKAKDL